MINFKKLLAGTLSAAMVLGTMAMPVFADEPVTPGTTGSVTVSGVKIAEGKTYNTIQEAYNEIKAELETKAGLVEQPLNEENFNAFFTDGGKITWTISGEQKVTDSRMFSFGRGANRFGEGRHITEIDIVGDENAILDLSDVNGTFALPYNWWNVEDSTNTALKCKNITFDGIKSMPSATYQCKLYPTTYEFDGCTFNGNLYSYQNFDVDMTIKNSTFKAPDNTTQYAFMSQGQGGTIALDNNKFYGYTRGINLQRATANFIVTKNFIESSVSESDRGAVQITDGKSFVITGNTIDVNGGNAFWFHDAATNSDVTYTISDNNIKAPYLANDDTNFGVNNKIKAVGNIYNNTDTEKCMEKDATEATESAVTAFRSVAKIGDKEYTSLADAVAAANDNDTIKILSDVTESVEIAADKNITLDLNGKTLTNTGDANTITNNGTLEIVDSSADKTGKVKNANTSKAILFNAGGATATLNGGTFERTEPKTYYAIKNLGTMTINDGVTVNQFNESSSAVANGCANSREYTGKDVKLTINGGTFVQGLITIKNDECGVLEINGGSFKNIKGNYTVFNWNKAVINDGTFEANYVVGNGKYNEKAVGDVDIKGGTFNGIICPDQPAVGYTPYPSEDISISGGTFSTDVSAYCADGYQLAQNADGKYVAVLKTLTNGIEVKFEQVEGNAGLYNIVLKATDTNAINRLTTADLTFKLVSNDAITYEIKKVGDMNVTANANNYNRYLFNFDGVNKADATDTEIVIGQVEFTGYGKFTFGVDSNANNTNIVNATKTVDNIVTSYVVNGGTTTGEGTLDLGDGITNGEIKQETAKLTVNVSFPNAIKDNAVAYQNMKVTVSGNGVNKEFKLGTGDDGVALNNDKYTVNIENELVKNNTYTVTVSGAGYRTARYTVSMTGNKELNFWNNVKTAPAYVEETVGNPTDTNFLAGDIVKDGQINIYDLSAVVSYFGTDNLVSAHPTYAKYDLNRDGVIDSKDVAYVLVSWGM